MARRQGALRSARARLLAAPLLAALACLVVCAPASAGTAELHAGQLSYSAEDGEVNNVTVTGGSGQITLRDAGNTVLIFSGGDPGCSHPNGASDTVSCPATSIDVQAGDMDDSVDASGSDIAGAGGVGGVFIGGGGGNDTLVGGPRIDTLNGDAGNDKVDGHAGDDFLTGGDGNDKLAGGDGNDSFENVAFATFGDDTIDGGSGDDTLVQPQRGNGAMSDGADTFNGGDGRDTANYGSSESFLTVSLDGTANDGFGNEGDNVGADVEVVTGGSATDTLVGSDGANTLDGGGGDDHLMGMGGDDQLDGGDDAGSDTLDGGDGGDNLVGGPGDDGLSGGEGADALDGSGGTDTESGGDGGDAVSGGAGADTIDGGPGDDLLRGADQSGLGGDGTDVIHGGSGADQVSGEAGDDTMDGGPGADALSGGDGTDKAEFQSETKPVSVTIDGKANDGAPAEHDNVAVDIEGVVGGNHGSTVHGTSADNALSGGSGEDYADGSAGSDTLEGGRAADTLRSRDGLPDKVQCGPGAPDFAIADTSDKVKGCEIVDRGHSKPIAGRQVVVQPASTSFVKLNHVHRFVPLSDSDRVGLPIRSTIQPLAAGVKLSAVTRGRGGGRATGNFSGDAFLVKQGRRSHATELDLAGPFNLSKCPRGHGAAATAAAKRPRRRLFGSAHGRFVTRGRFSSATVRGTRWSIEDRCDGTLTHVFQGSVKVSDFGTRRTVTVKAGHSYLARRGNR